MSHSRAFDDFTKRLSDIDVLLGVHAKIGGNNRGRRGRDSTVLNESAVVLATAAWEAFVEDLVGEALEHLIKKAPASDLFPSELKMAALGRLKATKGFKEIDYWKLADKGYEPFVRASFEKQREDFHNPTSANCSDFVEAHLGVKNLATRVWGNKASKLDRLVDLRHKVAHGRIKKTVHKKTVAGFRAMLEDLAVATENEVGGAVEKTLSPHYPKSNARGRPHKTSPW